MRQMNTSRDIEKLFDHFGGNASDYQEIGRENEAKTARTRWPLLATLDLTQPAIPAIPAVPAIPASAQRRQATSQPLRTERAENETAPDKEALTPIFRGKPPLFARAHRRTIPPVDAKGALDTVRKSRFADSADASPAASSDTQNARGELWQTPDFASAIAADSTHVTHATHANAAHASPSHRAQTTGASSPRPASLRESLAPASSTRPDTARKTDGEHRPASQEQTSPSASSILGKLFAPKQPAPAPAQPSQADSLAAIFTRLRKADTDPRP
jgi:hypothetical protein